VDDDHIERGVFDGLVDLVIQDGLIHLSPPAVWGYDPATT
jgi:hypothetical protein